MKRRTRILCLIFAFVMLFTSSLGVISAIAAEEGNKLIQKSDIPLRLRYDEEAPKINENLEKATTDGKNEDIGWAKWSLPIGNGYFGANVFGRTETERIQITEKTLMNPTSIKVDGEWHTIGGLNNFSETYIDFGHTNSAVTDYERYLDIATAISGVSYKYGGVNYTREYFTSYPDKALVIKLDASESGALSFTLRPTIAYERSFAVKAGDKTSKKGTVTSSVDSGVGKIELAGKMAHYDIDFLAMYNVYTDGGTVTASTVNNTYKEPDGTIVTDQDGVINVTGAKSAYIVVTLGTDYELSEDVFTSPDTDKPTKKTDISYTRAKIGGYMAAIEAKISSKSFNEAYKILKDAHIADHSALFGRVSLDLGYTEADINATTDALLDAYKAGTNKSAYLETLLFQYGRYLLIASSREGALPANLQGAWNTYNTPAWACAYTHNINVQMNYWPAFITNLAETFESYVDYNQAYMAQAKIEADKLINQHNPGVSGDDGGNGWVIGNHIYPYRYTSDRSAGNLGFITQVFWDYYEFTKDPEALKAVYSVLIEAARYITKCVEKDENGNYLVSHCDSPEVHVGGEWYYTVGTTYAQTFAYLNNYHALMAAKDLGIDFSDKNGEDYDIIKTVLEQIDKYDPIHVGLSGQLKEFREEDYYSSIGDDPTHRHVSQLMCLYPGNIVTSETDAWLDAAEVSLNNRGLGGMGWSRAHRMALYARIKNGEGAYRLMDALIKQTNPNLWNMGPPFQIDGSFGYTAGVAEMLLQSHEGYIAPLAAIPTSWSSGSYTGLVARGNFEVSAAWENGLAKTFNIKSNLGGKVSVYYPSIETARVVDSKGTAVSYTVEENGSITFDTVKGETYIVYGFKELFKPDAVANLKCTESQPYVMNFSWAASSGAESYNIYVAIDNAASYTLLGSTSATSFTYTVPEEARDVRTTYAVTAVGDIESKRSLVYTSEGVDTPYGRVPVSATGENVVAVFAKKANDTNFTFVESGTNLVDGGFTRAMQLLERGKGEYAGGTVALYLLGDYTSKGAAANGAGWNTACLADGLVILDLGGKTLTSSAPRLIGFEAKNGACGYTTAVEVKNGKLSTSKPIVEIFGSAGVYEGVKQCSVKFENITFDITSSSFTMFTSRGSYGGNQKGALDIELVNCDINYAKDGALTFLKDSTQAGSVASKLNVRGGSFTAESLEKLAFGAGLTDEDGVIFTKTESGKRVNFTFNYSPFSPTAVFATEQGDMHLASNSIPKTTKEDLKTLTFTLSDEYRGFGYVPEDLKDKTFSLFYNGLHIDSYDIFGDKSNLMNKARELLYPAKTSGVHNGIFVGESLGIYMSKDYEATEAVFDNLAQIEGSVTIDLGGNTFSQKNGRTFDLVGKAVDGQLLNTGITVKNGKILLNDMPLMRISSSGTSGNFGYTGTKSFTFSYEFVTFERMKGAAANPMIKVEDFRDNSGAKNLSLAASFKNCSFDMGTSLIFDLSVSNFVDAEISVIGGSIKAPDMAGAVMRFSDSSDKLTFEKSKGQYPLFILPRSAAEPTVRFGSLKLIKTEDNANTATYELVAENLEWISPKMSFSLDGTLTAKAYVPVANTLEFTLGDTRYTDLEALPKETIGGIEYYVASFGIAAPSAAEEIYLGVRAKLGSSDAWGSFTISAPIYAREILASGTEEEKAIAKDLISYIRAAYAYFDKNSTDIINSLSDIIGESYDSESVYTPGTPGEVPDGLIGATFILGSTPSVRFYIDSENDPESYSFRASGCELEFTSGIDTNGKYINIILSPELVLANVEISIDNSFKGCYNINNYYNWVSNQDNEALENLVLRFMKFYSEVE